MTERRGGRGREAKEKTAVAGGDIQRRACTRREKERYSERVLCAADAFPFFRIVGWTDGQSL